jgi:hypothetical protein
MWRQDQRTAAATSPRSRARSSSAPASEFPTGAVLRRGDEDRHCEPAARYGRRAPTQVGTARQGPSVPEGSPPPGGHGARASGHRLHEGKGCRVSRQLLLARLPRAWHCAQEQRHLLGAEAQGEHRARPARQRGPDDGRLAGQEGVGARGSRSRCCRDRADRPLTLGSTQSSTRQTRRWAMMVDVFSRSLHSLSMTCGGTRDRRRSGSVSHPPRTVLGHEGIAARRTPNRVAVTTVGGGHG